MMSDEGNNNTLSLRCMKSNEAGQTTAGTDAAATLAGHNVTEWG